MKLLKTVPAAVMLAGGLFASVGAMADDSVFTVMDDPSAAKKPFEGVVNAGYLAQSGNTKSSSMTADSTLTWYGNTTAWSLWGNASNTSSNDERSSEKYAVGGRSRYNLTDMNYVFGQGSWLTDRYNGYQQRDVVTAGYGRQILNGPVHSLRFEFGPGVRYDEYTDGDTDTQPLGYASGTWACQMPELCSTDQYFLIWMKHCHVERCIRFYRCGNDCKINRSPSHRFHRLRCGMIVDLQPDSRVCIVKLF